MIKYKKSIKVVTFVLVVLALVSVSSCAEDGSSSSSNFKDLNGATAPGTMNGN